MPRRLTAAVLSFVTSAVLGAQDAELTVKPPQDSALSRARQLVVDGHAAEGRRMIDSVMRTSPNDPSIYAEALFWRAALATTAADAERDYRRLLIEAPFSARAEDALVQLAQLVQARGDRRTASDHLYRYMISYGRSPDRPSRPRIAIWLVRLSFETDNLNRGCEALRMAREAISSDHVELRNQLESYAPRCAYAEASPSSPAPASMSVDTVDVPALDSVRRPVATKTATAKPATAKAGTKAAAKVESREPKSENREPFYSVQVAAYESREAAARMAEVLVSRGVDARVDGNTRPFRVRVGKYATRAEAVKVAQTLKSQGQNGFVTIVR